MSLQMPSQSLAELRRAYAEDKAALADKRTKFYGWVRRTRVGNKGAIVFIDLYDGTQVGVLNCLASQEDYAGAAAAEPAAAAEDSAAGKAEGDAEAPQAAGDDDNNSSGAAELPQSIDELDLGTALTYEQLSQSEHLSCGCAIVVEGTIVLSPEGATQDFEFVVNLVRVIGGVEDPKTYPLQGKNTERRLTSLRQIPFLRFRAQATQCLFRIRSKLALGVHLFMDQEDVELTDPNIMTMSDCEGAGETFTVTPAMFGHKDENDNDVPVGLTVSSQLPLEAAICGFRQVYTCQKSFRAEESDTSKHLAEFLHVEYEGAFLAMEQLLQQAERFVKFVINYAYSRCKDDLDWLATRFAPTDMKSSRALLTECLERPFVRIKHREAIDLIRKLVKEKTMLPADNGKLQRVKVKVFPNYDDDLGSEHESLLVRYFGYMAVPEDEREARLKEGKEFGAFVFVTHWPIKIKAFYMAQCDDGSGECESFDLLCPRVGELFGGSMREWRFDKLDEEIKRREMNVSPIQWFLDLRKSGSAPHGGWGMGFDRLCMLVTGVQSVRDVVAFPVYYQHCPY